MLHPELRDISPNDYVDWEAFAAAERPEPWDDFGWFVPEALSASALLRALATPAGEREDSWENWFGTRDVVAEEAMRAGIDWLAEVYRVGSGSEWALVWVG